jgi:hypothetical protein
MNGEGVVSENVRFEIGSSPCSHYDSVRGEWSYCTINSYLGTR